jgi:cytochrome bd-type quinol oxidase subunit 1
VGQHPQFFRAKALVTALGGLVYSGTVDCSAGRLDCGGSRPSALDVFGMLPTHLSASSVSAASLWGSIAGFIGFYTLLLIAEMYLMFKYARTGPTILEPLQQGA